MSRSLQLLALVLAIGVTPVRAQIPSVSLEEAVRRAQQSLPTVVQAQSQVRNAEAQVRSARGAYLPNLTASSNAASSFSAGPSFTNGNGTVVSGDRTSKSVSMGLSSASVDLFTGFRRGADSRAAQGHPGPRRRRRSPMRSSRPR